MEKDRQPDELGKSSLLPVYLCHHGRFDVSSMEVKGRVASLRTPHLGSELAPKLICSVASAVCLPDQDGDLPDILNHSDGKTRKHTHKG